MKNTNLKALFSVVLLLVLTLSFVASAKGTVTQWSFPLLENEGEKVWIPFIERFNELHPDVQIQVEIMPWAGRDERMLTAVASGNPPDVVYLNEFFLQTFTSRGALEPINKYIDAQVLRETFSEPLLNTGLQDGDYYLVPMLTSTVGMVYNKNIVEAVGWDINQLPETWDEFLAFAEDVKQYAKDTKQDIWPVGYTAAMEDTLNMTLFPLIWQAGGDILTDDLSKAAFNSPAGVAAFEFLRTLAENEYVSKSMITTGGLEDYFLDGRLAVQMSVDAPQVSAMRERDPNYDSYAVVGPILKQEKQITYGTLGAWAIFRNSKNPEGAAKWIEFLISPEVNVEFNKLTGFMSPIQGAPTLFGDDPLLSVLEQQRVYARGGMVIEQERRVMDVLKRAQQAIMLGEATIEQALYDAENEVNFILR